MPTESVYDPAKRIACFVTTDTNRAFGPALEDVDNAGILDVFITSMPYDVAVMTERQLHEAFTQFITLATTDDGDVDPTVVPPVGNGQPSPEVDPANPTVIGTAEGAPTDEPPPAAPADTDTPAQGVVTKTVCPNCNGDGTINWGDPPTSQTCPMCNGSKVIETVTPS